MCVCVLCGGGLIKNIGDSQCYVSLLRYKGIFATKLNDCATPPTTHTRTHTFTGIPELRSIEDVEWIEKKLLLDTIPVRDGDGRDVKELDGHFIKLIAESLTCQRTRINDAVHLIKHA